MPLRTETGPVCRPFLGVPGFFRACCIQASWGQGRSYRDAGYHLAIHITDLLSHGYEDEEDFALRLAVLRDYLCADDRKAVLRWLVQEYPNCMALVPRRRRQLFIDGVLLAFESDRLRIRSREEGGAR